MTVSGLPMSNLQFYDPAKTLSYNRMINIVLSLRNGGKTYGCLKLAVNTYLKTGRQFIYLRRSKEEVKACKNQLFMPFIHNNEFSGHQFAVKGNLAMCDGKICGYFQNLSTAAQVKSNGFPGVKYIIFDECLIEKGQGSATSQRYLNNEPELLLGFIETVQRLNTDVKVFLLGNFSTRANPYFIYWNLYPQRNSTFVKHPTKSILIHIFRSSSIEEYKKSSELGQIVSGTGYGDFMYSNNPYLDNYSFIENPTGFLTSIATFRYQNKTFGEWYDHGKGLMYITNKIDPSNKNVFSFDTDSHTPNVLYIRKMKSHPVLKDLRFAYNNGLMRFSDLYLKNTVLDLLDQV